MAYSSLALKSNKLKKELRQLFNGVKYSVRCRGGGAINVYWTDGPKKKDVEALVKKYEHIDRDEFGDILSGANQFVFLVRDYSPAKIEAVKKECFEQYADYAHYGSAENAFNCNSKFMGLVYEKLEK
jgi:hypothetical protein